MWKCVCCSVRFGLSVCLCVGFGLFILSLTVCLFCLSCWKTEAVLAPFSSCLCFYLINKAVYLWSTCVANGFMSSTVLVWPWQSFSWWTLHANLLMLTHAVLKGTINSRKFIPLSVSLTLPGGHKVSRNKTRWLQFLALLNWSGWNLIWSWSNSTWTSWYSDRTLSEI